MGSLHLLTVGWPDTGVKQITQELEEARDIFMERCSRMGFKPLSSIHDMIGPFLIRGNVDIQPWILTWGDAIVQTGPLIELSTGGKIVSFRSTYDPQFPKMSDAILEWVEEVEKRIKENNEKTDASTQFPPKFDFRL